jgi:hypothetical protein
MCVQWCLPGAGEWADPEPADGEAAGEDCVDDERDDVVDAGEDAEPLVAAMATPAAPAPMPAARKAVMISRRTRPPVMDVMWLPPFCQCLGPRRGPR